jgi:hypothetical protein
MYNIWSEMKHQLLEAQWRLPIYLHDPLSVLQCLCEGMQYCQFLRLADTLDDSSFRMGHVVAFVVA